MIAITRMMAITGGAVQIFRYLLRLGHGSCCLDRFFHPAATGLSQTSTFPSNFDVRSLKFLIHPFSNSRLESRERPDVANAVPRVRLARRLALGFVALQKSRHEELPGQCREPD